MTVDPAYSRVSPLRAAIVGAGSVVTKDVEEARYPIMFPRRKCTPSLISAVHAT
jgi:hypothetical protein